MTVSLIRFGWKHPSAPTPRVPQVNLYELLPPAKLSEGKKVSDTPPYQDTVTSLLAGNFLKALRRLNLQTVEQQQTGWHISVLLLPSYRSFEMLQVTLETGFDPPKQQWQAMIRPNGSVAQLRLNGIPIKVTEIQTELQYSSAVRLIDAGLRGLYSTLYEQISMSRNGGG